MFKHVRCDENDIADKKDLWLSAYILLEIVNRQITWEC